MCTIAIASDHAGYELKSSIINFLQSYTAKDSEVGEIKVVDMGTNNAEEPVDYPDYAAIVCEKILDDEADSGILICGTGIGMSIAANRRSGIRAALCLDTYMALKSRTHNNANILVLGARVITFEKAKDILITFINSKFKGGRHTHRLKKID